MEAGSKVEDSGSTRVGNGVCMFVRIYMQPLLFCCADYALVLDDYLSNCKCFTMGVCWRPTTCTMPPNC